MKAPQSERPIEVPAFLAKTMWALLVELAPQGGQWERRRSVPLLRGEPLQAPEEVPDGCSYHRQPRD